MRKIELDKFKNFLRENDAYFYYKLWIDIEKLSTIFDEKEKAK
jgi:hypothetical protein